jgi:tetratricopeptide (TPR) repeat protein
MNDWLDDADALVAEGDYEGALNAAAAAHAQAEGFARVRAARALAVVHQCLGQIDAAARHADEAIEGFEAAGEGSHRELAEALHVRAVVDLSRGDIGRAGPLLERAATILEEAGAIHDLASVLLTMAEVALALGDDEVAEGIYGRVLDDVDGSEPESEDHASFLNALTGKAFIGLGAVAVQRDQAAEAKDYLSRAIEFYDAAHGYAHPETIDALAEIAALYRELGDENAAAATDEERRVAEEMLAGVEAASPKQPEPS